MVSIAESEIVPAVARIARQGMTTVAPGYAVEGESARLFSKRVANGGSVTYSGGQYVLTTTAAAGSTAIHIGNVHGFYRPGFILRPAMTVSLDAPNTTNVRIEWGGFGGVASSATSLLAADACGFYVQNGVFGVFVRNSLDGAFPGNTIDVPQADWNGSKRIGIADLGVKRLYYPDLLWYGAADVDWYIKDTFVHRISFDEPPHYSADPYMLVPHLRLGVLVHNLGAAAPVTVKYNCGSVHSLGGASIPEFRAASAVRNTDVTCGAVTRVPVMAFRMSASTKAVRGLLSSFLAENSGTQDADFEVFVGRDGTDITLTGASWAATDEGPMAEYDVSSTAITLAAAARRIGGAYVNTTGGSPNAENKAMGAISSELGESFGIEGDGASRIMVIVARARTGTTTVRIRRAELELLGYG